MENFNPKSIDSTLTRMECRQKENSVKLDRIIARQDSHEERIENLERFKWWLLGAVGAGSAGGAAALSKLFGS